MSKYDLDSVPWRDEAPPRHAARSPRRRLVVGSITAASVGVVALVAIPPALSMTAEPPATPRTPAQSSAASAVTKPAIRSFSCTRTGDAIKAEVDYSTGGSGGTVTIDLGPVTTSKDIEADSSWASAAASASESSQTCTVSVATSGGTVSRSMSTE